MADLWAPVTRLPVWAGGHSRCRKTRRRRSDAQHDNLFIGGEWISPSSNQTSRGVASTEEVIGSVPSPGRRRRYRVAAASGVRRPERWSSWSPRRGGAMERFADGLEKRAGDPKLVSAQNGMRCDLDGVRGCVPGGAAALLRRRDQAGRPRGGAAGLMGAPGDRRARSGGRRDRAVELPQSLAAFSTPGAGAGCTLVIKPRRRRCWTRCWSRPPPSRASRAA